KIEEISKKSKCAKCERASIDRKYDLTIPHHNAPGVTTINFVCSEACRIDLMSDVRYDTNTDFYCICGKKEPFPYRTFLECEICCCKFYCSEECKEKDKEGHKKECVPTSKKLKRRELPTCDRCGNNSKG